MSFSPDADAEARDSEPEAHVMEPLADDHSSDSDDTPTGIEESAAPAAPKRTVMSLLEAASNPFHITGAGHHHDSTLPLCRSQNELGVTSARAYMSASIASLSFVVPRFSPVPSHALRMGSNDQCDGNLCCPSFGGCPRGHHPGVEPAAQCASTRENSPGSDTQ